jgi:hypothetical protein
MKIVQLFVILCLAHIGWANAEIYKRVDADGHVTYSSEPIKGGKKLELRPLPTMPGMRSSRNSTPEDFPSVDSRTQKSRDITRRLILQDELSTEEQQMEQARQALSTLEQNPVPIVGPDGVLFRNSSVYAEKLKAAQEAVSAHEQNIKALKTEISNLK